MHWMEKNECEGKWKMEKREEKIKKSVWAKKEWTVMVMIMMIMIKDETEHKIQNIGMLAMTLPVQWTIYDASFEIEAASL